jgi:cbb3-type cytochrome oxidase subunit 3
MLRDVMSAASLSFFAEVSLVLFMGVFVALAVYLFVTRGSAHWEAARYLPLDDDLPQGDRTGDASGGGES